ncbi:sugar ABC transporter permease [Oceanobacillus zhaokaii]|uniref:Sugar ABC transporter permease n=1 Tax=Oceanobacillus zhaokaii TaxID=2052660 RepID=A0A345PK83_9BACI|nr:sugar ABC transporter permease [Oceanobacillus zhaokaii]AXI10413.1 sugar ABC transporter permease [Oceanobacillus zhaokaii]
MKEAKEIREFDTELKALPISSNAKQQGRNRKPIFKGWKDTIVGYIFISPMFIGTSILVIFPILATIFLSFTDWNFITGVGGFNFIGLENFKTLLGDDIFIKSLIHNFILLLVVPIGLLISLTLAVIINNHVYFKDVFKVVYFMPYISSVVAVAIVFQVLFHPTMGPINQLLLSLGVENPPGWIADTNFALISVMVILIWMNIGFQLIIYLAGLQNIPKELYEAAEMDGASAWYKFRKITVPLVSPTTFLLLVTGFISTFKVFDLIVVLTNGGPANSTSVPVFYLYQQAFIELKTGYSSAIALILLVLVLLITFLQWLGQKKWVNY